MSNYKNIQQPPTDAGAPAPTEKKAVPGLHPPGAHRAAPPAPAGAKFGAPNQEHSGADVQPKAGNPRRLTSIRPVAAPARMRPRHWGLLICFISLVVLPVFLAVFYLFVVGKDQYASTVGFTVRREEGNDAVDFLGGLSKFSGASSGSESDILYEFIQSQEIVQAIDAGIDLRKMYAQNWSSDPVFALRPSASVESLLWYWTRMVRISYDQGTRLMELRVLAFSPEDAQKIASAIVAESQSMINALNTAARQDVMRYAQEDLETALTRLKTSREALTKFRTRTQIVDPESDIQGRMGVLGNLQQKLAESLIENDLLQLQTENNSDPRLAQASRRIEVIRERIAAERRSFATASHEVGEVGEDYPTLIAEYESLAVDREYAEESYRLALASLDLARAEASRQSLYLAAYIRPTLPETSEFPQRFVLSGLVALFLLLTWAIVILIYYSIRDRR